MLNDIVDYVNGDMPYPRHYKVNGRNYFILIRTPLDSLAEFHANSKEVRPVVQTQKEVSKYDEEQEGWYQCTKLFKRVLPHTEDNPRCVIVDSTIEILVYGSTPRDCHEKIISYLRSREDIDPRSQYPALKEATFAYEYKGKQLN